MSGRDNPAERYLPRGLSRELAAHVVGVSPNTFDRMVTDGLMPAPKRVYSRKIWILRDVEMALDALPCDGAESPNPFDAD